MAATRRDFFGAPKVKGPRVNGAGIGRFATKRVVDARYVGTDPTSVALSVCKVAMRRGT